MGRPQLRISLREEWLLWNIIWKLTFLLSFVFQFTYYCILCFITFIPSPEYSFSLQYSSSCFTCMFHSLGFSLASLPSSFIWLNRLVSFHSPSRIFYVLLSHILWVVGILKVFCLFFFFATPCLLYLLHTDEYNTSWSATPTTFLFMWICMLYFDSELR